VRTLGSTSPQRTSPLRTSQRRSGRPLHAPAPLTRQAQGQAPPVLLLAPMWPEARALREGAPWAEVRRIGIGPRRAAQAARRIALGEDSRAVVLAGFAGALDEHLEPGDVVLADALQAPGGGTPLPDPAILAGVLRRGGLRVHVGAVACSRAPVAGRARGRWAATGALAVEMESAALARRLGGRPLTVLRVVLDTPRAELHRPQRLARAAASAYRSLRRAAGLLAEWLPALGERELLLAGPRASCAGVERAVQIVERALDSFGAPVHVRRQIVHNAHVIADLERRGAVFVEEIDEVPDGATVIFSAHGVSPAVRRAAEERELHVIDATCPLVAKVHAEARRYSAGGFEIVLVGHAGHEEVEGTYGEAPERTQIVATTADVERLEVNAGSRVAYLTQTTLAQDETAGIIAALRRRFPQLQSPPRSDICYATQNRQEAVRALAPHVDAVLVVGSENSSNARRLVEVAERAGASARLIEDAAQITPEMVAGTERIGLTAGASTPERLVREVARALTGLGPTVARELAVTAEDVTFKLPLEVRGGH
jgi:4-hydroxy-3-methylbut-2-enyl diphosphate reductase